MKFRRKPKLVEAEQWFPGKQVAGVREAAEGELPAPYVITANGEIVYVEAGDWIVAEADGNGFYTHKPEIFEATFEPAGKRQRQQRIEEILEAQEALRRESTDALEFAKHEAQTPAGD